MPAFCFHIPAGILPSDREALLTHVGLCSGPSADAFPELTFRAMEGENLTIRSESSESCHLVAPWVIGDKGRVLLKTATLSPDFSPYDLQLELARGKIHQIYSIVSDMGYRGLKIGNMAPELIEEATKSFGKALCSPSIMESAGHADSAIRLASQAADAYLADYQRHLVSLKTQGSGKVETVLSFTLRGRIPNPDQASVLRKAFSGVSICIPWSRLQSGKAQWNWEPLDSALAWARSHGFVITIGPILTPDPSLIPSWLTESKVDVNSIASHFSRYVDQLLKRYISLGFSGRFNIINSGNVAQVGELSEDEWLRLSWQALDSAKQVDGPNEITMGIRQPWGDIMAREARDHNPANYLDTLVRSVGNISSVEIEALTGSITGATHCRDFLDYYRLPEIFYGISQKPIRMVIALPSNKKCNSEESTSAVGFSQAHQAAFMHRLGEIFAASPYVNEIRWHQTFDDDPGGVEGAGLFDDDGKPKPVVQSCIRLREQIIR